MNQCKRLSDCPADRLAQCRGEVVPPAGDVEVVVYACGPANQRRYVEPGNAFLGWHVDDATALVDRVHVTRLTAERDGLRAELCARAGQIGSLAGERDAAQSECGRLKARGDKHWRALIDMRDERDALQSELNKARELLKGAFELACRGSAIPRYFIDDMDKFFREERQPATPIAHNVDESSGQDAEAATKENKQQALDAVDWWDKHCESPEGVKDAEAAKGEHCSTCSKLNGSSYCDCGQE